jgi:hypothetical protein
VFAFLLLALVSYQADEEALFNSDFDPAIGILGTSMILPATVSPVDIEAHGEIRSRLLAVCFTVCLTEESGVV